MPSLTRRQVREQGPALPSDCPQPPPPLEQKFSSWPKESRRENVFEEYGDHPPDSDLLPVLQDMLNQILEKLSSLDMKVSTLGKRGADPMSRDFNHTRGEILLPTLENTFGPRSKPYQIRNRPLFLGVTLIICVLTLLYLEPSAVWNDSWMSGSVNVCEIPSVLYAWAQRTAHGDLYGCFPGRHESC